jgi:NAD(P)-dependent dehydrogenase (short-subunit alcohol dehydrogenase family)
MKVALTGAAGSIGFHIPTELHEHGHEVIALIREDAQSDVAKARGATPVVIDLYDRLTITSLLADADAAFQTASPRDAIRAGLDPSVVDAVAGTGKPHKRCARHRIGAREPGKLAPIVEGQSHEDNRPGGIVLVREASDGG